MKITILKNSKKLTVMKITLNLVVTVKSEIKKRKIKIYQHTIKLHQRRKGTLRPVHQRELEIYTPNYERCQFF